LFTANCIQTPFNPFLESASPTVGIRANLRG